MSVIYDYHKVFCCLFSAINCEITKSTKTIFFLNQSGYALYFHKQLILKAYFSLMQP